MKTWLVGCDLGSHSCGGAARGDSVRCWCLFIVLLLLTGGKSFEMGFLGALSSGGTLFATPAAVDLSTSGMFDSGRDAGVSGERGAAGFMSDFAPDVSGVTIEGASSRWFFAAGLSSGEVLIVTPTLPSLDSTSAFRLVPATSLWLNGWSSLLLDAVSLSLFWPEMDIFKPGEEYFPPEEEPAASLLVADLSLGVLRCTLLEVDLDVAAADNGLEMSSDSFSFLICLSSFSFLIVSLMGGFSGSGAGSGVLATGAADVVGTEAGTGTSSSSESSMIGFFLRFGVELPRRDRSNMSISRSSRMFSSGSQVLCRVLHPFHLTRYSTLPWGRGRWRKL